MHSGSKARAAKSDLSRRAGRDGDISCQHPVKSGRAIWKSRIIRTRRRADAARVPRCFLQFRLLQRMVAVPIRVACEIVGWVVGMLRFTNPIDIADSFLSPEKEMEERFQKRLEALEFKD